MIEREMDNRVFADYERKKHWRYDQRKDRQAALVRDRVAKLSREERLVVYLRFWEGLSFSSIAAQIELPIDLTIKIFSHALDNLRSELVSALRKDSGEELVAA